MKIIYIFVLILNPVLALVLLLSSRLYCFWRSRIMCLIAFQLFIHLCEVLDFVYRVASRFVFRVGMWIWFAISFWVCSSIHQLFFFFFFSQVLLTSQKYLPELDIIIPCNGKFVPASWVG